MLIMNLMSFGREFVSHESVQEGKQKNQRGYQIERIRTDAMPEYITHTTSFRIPVVFNPMNPITAFLLKLGRTVIFRIAAQWDREGS